MKATTYLNAVEKAHIDYLIRADELENKRSWRQYVKFRTRLLEKIERLEWENGNLKILHNISVARNRLQEDK